MSDYNIYPKPNSFTERYKFKERRQGSKESIKQYVAILQKMSKYCEYGAFLDDSMCDQLVLWNC